MRITFKVNQYNVSGMRYTEVTKRAGLKVDRLDQFLGSCGPSSDAYVKNFDAEESPSGPIAQSGSYIARSRLVSDNGDVYAGWNCSPLCDIFHVLEVRIRLRMAFQIGDGKARMRGRFHI